MTPADVVTRWKVAAQIHPALEAAMDAVSQMKYALGPGAGLTDDTLHDDSYTGEVRCKDGSTFTIQVDIHNNGNVTSWASVNFPTADPAANMVAQKAFKQRLEKKMVVADKVIYVLSDAPQIAAQLYKTVARAGVGANTESLRKAYDALQMANEAGAYVDDDPNIKAAITHAREGGKVRLAEALERAAEDFAEAQHKYNNALSAARNALQDY